MMLRTVILALSFCLMSCGGGAPTPTLTASEPRVLGGTPAAGVDSPQFVQILVPGLDGSTALCSGTAIGAHHVLTAAHCVLGTLPPVILRFDGVAIPVAQAHISPSFREEASLSALFDDVAILETTEPHGIPTLPILLPESGSPVAGESVYLFGFGLNERGESGILHSGVLQLDAVTPNHLMRFYDGMGANSCFGDSGGALIRFDANGIPAIVGISSSGTVSDCGSGDLSLFINVQSSSVLAFIQSIVPDAALL